MDEFTSAILEKLKTSYEMLFGVKPYKQSSGMKAYWLDDYKDNLIHPMDKTAKDAYGKGAGNEITSGKIGALKSSSALTYNTFWNRTAEVVCENNKLGIGKGVYEVEFEKKLRTLKSSSMPSHMDAFLYCKETKQAVACEMKMTEWLFNPPGNLRTAYLDSDKYEDTKAGEKFALVAEKMIAEKVIVKHKEKTVEEYRSVFSTYDAFQMFKHALACYTAYMTNDPGKIKKLTLVNCVWTLPQKYMLSGELGEKYIKAEIAEKNEFEVFKKMMNPIRDLFAEKDVDFNIQFITYSDFLGVFKKAKKELDYLKRYTFE